MLQKYMYESLQDSDDYEAEPLQKRNRIDLSTLLFSIACLCCTAAGIVIGCVLRPSVLEEWSWLPELASLQRHATRFNGSFEFNGRFRGPPSPVIDREWNQFTRHAVVDGTGSLIAVSESDIRNSNKTSSRDWFNSTVAYPEADGGGYMATLELFHQVHCLNMLRMAIHSDYYEGMRPQANGSYNRLLGTHLDHCIEILRQVLFCNGDTGLITFHWVEGNPTPYPDFNTWHQCRDGDAILAWSRAREARTNTPLVKPQSPELVQMRVAP